jgi:5'-nucleotidase
VLVAAPLWDASGSSSSVTGVSQIGEVVSEPRDWPGWDEAQVMAVDATPALIALYALHGKLGRRPDLVLSGINRGANTGRSILHSGTVGAAFTAYQQECPALAVSSDVLDMSSSAPVHWETASEVAGRIFDWLVADKRCVVINCNVPNVALDELEGVRVGSLARIGVSQTVLTEESGGALPLTVGGGGEPVDGTSDVALLEKGYASVTALLPVVEDTRIDLASDLALRLAQPFSMTG